MALPRNKNAKSASPAPAQPAAPAPERSMPKGSGTTARPQVPATREITQDLIAKRAYEIYAARGFAPGNPDEDWYEAERQLRAGL